MTTGMHPGAAAPWGGTVLARVVDQATGRWGAALVASDGRSQAS